MSLIRRDCAIVVLSCDKYSGLWKPFFNQFKKYWPHCPYKVYLGSNVKTSTIPNVISIKSKVNKDWSSNTLELFKQINEPYVFIWLDDFFVTDTVSTTNFNLGFNWLKKEHAVHIHLAPDIMPDDIAPNSRFGKYKRGAPYRVAVAGFWQKNEFMRLLLPGESPQQFEVFGSYRSSYTDGYYCFLEPLFSFIQVIERGKIFREAYIYCMRHSITLDTRTFEVNSRFKKIRSDFLRFVFSKIIKIPWKHRVQVMDVLRKLLVSY